MKNLAERYFHCVTHGSDYRRAIHRSNPFAFVSFYFVVQCTLRRIILYYRVQLYASSVSSDAAGCGGISRGFIRADEWCRIRVCFSFLFVLSRIWYLSLSTARSTGEIYNWHALGNRIFIIQFVPRYGCSNWSYLSAKFAKGKRNDTAYEPIFRVNYVNVLCKVPKGELMTERDLPHRLSRLTIAELISTGDYELAKRSVCSSFHPLRVSFSFLLFAKRWIFVK